MKKTQVTYWLSTALLAVAMLLSAYACLTQEPMRQAFAHLGLPPWFRIELAIAKLLGAVALLLPLPLRPKEWAYAGFALTFGSAIIAHSVAGDPLGVRLPPLGALLLLAVSYWAYHRRLRTAPQVQPS